MLHQQKWIATGVWAVITAIGSWYYGAYAATIVCIFSGYQYLKSDDWSNLQPLRSIATMFVGIAIPAWIYSNMLSDSAQMFRGPTMDAYLTEHPRALAAFSSDPTLWLDEVPKSATHIDGLGWCFILLAISGMGQAILTNKWRDHWGWIVLLFLSLLMSLGPRLHISQQVVWEWMPYDIWMQLPFLHNMRLPHRWMSIAIISLTVWMAKGSKTMPFLGCFLLWGESVLFMPTIQNTYLPTPSIIEHFDGPVLQFPLRTMEMDARGRYLIMQRQHQQPIPYSLLMQGWSQALAEEPLSIAMTALDSRDPISSRTVEARQFRQETFALEVTAWGGFPTDKPQHQSLERLQSIGFTQVCFHRDLVDRNDLSAMEKLLIDTLGSPTITTSEAWLWTL